MNKINITVSFEVVEDKIIDSTSESHHEVKDVICEALQQYISNNFGIVDNKIIKIAAKLLEDVYR